jgi:hypothetical protein
MTTKTLDASVRAALARAVTDRTVSDDTIKAFTGQLEKLSGQAEIRRLDVTAYGIWIDYLVGRREWQKLLTSIFDTEIHIKKFEGFPWGVLADDLMHVKVEVELDGIAGVG